MPLKVKAIIDTIKGTKLCEGSLLRTRVQNKTYCVMGALLHAVGMTDKELEKVDGYCNEDDYWNVEEIQKFKPKLKRKFGIEKSRDITDLVTLNDGFSLVPDENDDEAFDKQLENEEKARTCHIMKTLVRREVKRLKKEQANAG